ncbi:MAG: hypothetical protein Q8K65_03465 [Alphaproteobacteria bacterium]|nr:hypothetical protein [Alphaproteobacteria bacterium]
MTGDSKELQKPRKKYAPPFSIRLTLAERARLDTEAGPLPLSDYIRTRLFDTPDTRQRVFRRPVQDAEALGLVLATLGNTRIAGNLYQIVRAVHDGTLSLTPAQQQDMELALQDIRQMRGWLMQALGMKDGDALKPLPEGDPPEVNA